MGMLGCRGSSWRLIGFRNEDSTYDVAPHHWCHVSFVVHEPGIKVWDFVRIGRRDMSRATRERIFEEMELGKVFSRRDVHVVSEKAGNDTVVHDRLVWLLLEVAIPSATELWGWPRVHFLQFVFSRPNLDSRFDTVCS